MTRLHISASVVGERFTPSRLPAKWSQCLLEQLDAGATAPTGRYRGQPAPQGFAIIGIGEKEGLEVLVDVLEKMRGDLEATGVEEMSIFVTLESAGGANWELSSELLARLGKLPAALLISGA